jgi:hypothetical protein
MRTFAILAASVAGAVVASAPAAAATISPQGIRGPQLAVGPTGVTVAAWERLRRHPFRIQVEARIGRSPDRLGPVQRLSSKGGRPVLAVGTDGTVAIGWSGSDSKGRRAGSAHVAVARPGRQLGRSQAIRGMGVSALAVQPNGRVVAVGLAKNRPAYPGALRVAMTTHGQRFGKPRTVEGATPTSEGWLAVDPRDGAVVLAHRTQAPAIDGERSQAAVRSLAQRATEFSPPVVLSRAGSYPVAVSGRGGAGVVYGDIALGPWPSDAPNACPSSGRRSAALPADGSAVAVWVVHVENPCGGPFEDQRYREEFHAFASIALRPAAFGPRMTVTRGSANVDELAVAAAGDEAFVAAAEHKGGRVTLATRASGAASLGRPRMLTRDGDGDVMLAAGGPHVVVAYQRNDRLRLKIVR